MGFWEMMAYWYFVGLECWLFLFESQAPHTVYTGMHCSRASSLFSWKQDSYCACFPADCLTENIILRSDTGEEQWGCAEDLTCWHAFACLTSSGLYSVR